MLKHTLTIGAISLGLIMSTSAMARSLPIPPDHKQIHQQHIQKCVSGHKINQRQAKQKQRIQNGIKKGQLVKWERVQLKSQQRQIRIAEKKLRQSGQCLTRWEAKKLLSRLDQASAKIRKLKQNHIRVSKPKRKHAAPYAQIKLISH